MTTPTVDLTVSPLVDARTAMAAAIESATGYTCHPSATEAFATPCAVLTPNGFTGTDPTTYTVQVTALFGPKTEPANQVEELARLIAIACIDFGARVEEVPAPATFKTGDREYAGVQFDATIPVTLREI